MTRIPLERKSVSSGKSRGFVGRGGRKLPTRKREEPKKGGDLISELTSQNRPTGPAELRRYRHLAVILENQVMVDLHIVHLLGREGKITGYFTQDEVDRLVALLRGGTPHRRP